MSALFFSFLVPNLGLSEDVFTCLSSLVNQKTLASFHFDIWLCDQSDESDFLSLQEEVLRRFPDAPINIIRSSTKSVALARHKLLKFCKCDYFCFIDSDDYVDEDLLLSIYSSLTAHKFPDILIYNVVFCDENGVDYHIQPSEPPDVPQRILDYFIYSDRLNSLARKFIKFDLYSAADYHDLSNASKEDFVMSFPLMTKAHTIVYEPTIRKYHYRQHPGTRTKVFSLASSIDTLTKYRDSPHYRNMTPFQKRLRLISLMSYFVMSSKGLVSRQTANPISLQEYKKYVVLFHDMLKEERIVFAHGLNKKHSLLFLLVKCKLSYFLWILFR